MVKFSLSKILPHAALLLASLAGITRADLQVTSPSSTIWWVAKSTNVIAWTCQNTTIQDFTILVSNSNSAVLAAPMAVIAIQQNYDCSIVISQDQANQPAGTGWTVLLADPLNNTNVYATSQPFEIKALGSAYPSQAPTGNVTASNTASGSSPSSTTKSASGATSDKVISFGIAGASVMGAISFLL
jgi:hypothetical protein